MIIRDLGLVDYQPVCADMQHFTTQREANTEDELWLLEHKPVFTLGQNAIDAHILQVSDIPIVRTDRGGQVTYHGPGQLVAYTLIDLKRRQLGVRHMISKLEQTIISMLAELGFEAYARQDAPGVYVDERKIASLGLRVKHGACYHGVSFNIDMDLTPFDYINPCGYQGMEVIDLKTLACDMSMSQAKQNFVSAFNRQMQQD